MLHLCVIMTIRKTTLLAILSIHTAFYALLTSFHMQEMMMVSLNRKRFENLCKYPQSFPIDMTNWNKCHFNIFLIMMDARATKTISARFCETRFYETCTDYIFYELYSIHFGDFSSLNMSHIDKNFVLVQQILEKSKKNPRLRLKIMFIT